MRALCCIVLLLTACASPAVVPPEVQILEPGPGVPPTLARWSGVWQGRLNSSRHEVTLAVERIHTTHLFVLFSVNAGRRQASSRLVLDRDFRREADVYVFRGPLRLEPPAEVRLMEASPGPAPRLLIEVEWIAGDPRTVARAVLEPVTR